MCHCLPVSEVANDKAAERQLATLFYTIFFHVASNIFSLYLILQFHHGVSSIRLILFTPFETGVLLAILSGIHILHLS